MIEIQEIKIQKNGDKSRLVFFILDNNKQKNLYFEVDEQYEKYLCYERADAVVLGLLHHAMNTNQNIKTNIPVTSQLLYNIKEILIPSLVKYDRNMHNIKIEAPLEFSAIENTGAVGTGVSCGIDSFHAILSNHNSQYKDLNITHLCIFNVGAFAPSYKEYGIEQIKNDRYSEAKEVAKKLGLPIIMTDSNFSELFPSVHSRTYSYLGAFAIYSLQKLWKVYYWGSSGYDFEEFSLKNNSDNDCGHYELLSLNCFSTDKLKIYPEGGCYNRFEKTEHIIDFPIVHEHLNVCINENNNCMRCHKCKRTLLTLEALNKLEKFNQVFDLNYYYKNKQKYYKWLYKKYLDGNTMLIPIYDRLKNKINLLTKIVIRTEFILRSLCRVGNTYDKNFKYKFLKILGIKIFIKRESIKGDNNA